MKSLVLASASPQRRKIMEILGLPFTVVPSKAEEITKLQKGVAHLVRHNALLKASDVADRMNAAQKSGQIKPCIVIGSDTVVYSWKKRLILKPKDLTEAKKNLKELMHKPHWVYSGVAIIDTSTGKTIVGHEKTKIFMTSMPDASIERYHSLVPPLDKAGGFDIEGKGGMFIPRIEGCYFNVVGLPLAKLTAMLKEFNIKAL